MQGAEQPVDGGGDGEAAEQGVGGGEPGPFPGTQSARVDPELDGADEADYDRGYCHVEQGEPARVAVLERVQVGDRDGEVGLLPGCGQAVLQEGRDGVAGGAGPVGFQPPGPVAWKTAKTRCS